MSSTHKTRGVAQSTLGTNFLTLKDDRCTNVRIMKYGYLSTIKLLQVRFKPFFVILISLNCTLKSYAI